MSYCKFLQSFHCSWSLILVEEGKKKAGTRSESKGSLALVTKVVLARGRVHSGVPEQQNRPETP